MAQGHLARESFVRKIFKLDLWLSDAGFFPIGRGEEIQTLNTIL